jgi:hypothetical protein
MNPGLRLRRRRAHFTGGGSSSSDFTDVSFTLTSELAGTNTLPFRIGHVFGKGDIPEYLTTDLAGTQIEITRRWNDGSVKHAILSNTINLTQNVASSAITITRSSVSPNSGAVLNATDVRNVFTSGSIVFGAYGTVNIATAIAASAPHWTHYANSKVIQCAWHVEAPGATGEAAGLGAWVFFTRYVDGRLFVRVQVHAASHGVTGPNYYDIIALAPLTVTVDGTSLESITMDGSSQPYFGWGMELPYSKWIGGSDPQIWPQFDLDYIDSTKLVPHYNPSYKSPSEATLNGLYTSYTGLLGANPRWGNYVTDMSTVGSLPHLGILTKPQALFMCTGDKRAYKSVIANEDYLLHFGVCKWRDPTTRRVSKPTDIPTWSWGGPNGTGKKEGNGTGWACTYDDPHAPSHGYLAYILTGDMWFLNALEMGSAKKWQAVTVTDGNITTNGMVFTNSAISGTNPGQGAERWLGGGQQRSLAWTWRTLAQHLAIAPDGDAVAADFRTLFSYNVQVAQYLYHQAEYAAVSSIGLFNYEGNSQLGSPPFWASTFMNYYVVQSLMHVGEIEPFSDPDDIANLNEVCDNVAKFIVGIFGGSDGSSYPFTRTGGNTIVIGPYADAIRADRMYADWATVKAQSTVAHEFIGEWASGAPVGNTYYNSSSVTDPTGYIRVGVAALSLAKDRHALRTCAPGANEAYTRAIGATNWTDSISELNHTPQFSISPR